MRKIKLNAETMQVLEEQKQAFIAKFGREPGPGDPILFDPTADEPRPLSRYQINAMHEEICAVMETVGIDPALIYAYRKTGRILTRENQQFLTRAELKEWRDAINEYHSQTGAMTFAVGYRL